jgi:P-loop Domain of unknown function (DUF2791)
MKDNTMLPEPRLARQIIEVLGQSGTPAPKGVSFYNVGNESLLNTIDTHYLSSYLVEGGAVFKLVVGDYGSGKSHFLYCLRDLAWQRNFAVSKVDLSPKESPYDDQKRVYAAVALSILWHEDGEMIEDERGLTRFLEATLRRMVAPHGLDLTDTAARDLPDVVALLQTLVHSPIDSGVYRRAVIGYFEALLHGNDQRIEALGRWLVGEEPSPDDMRDLRSIGVTEKITKNNAFKILRSLCQTVRALGYSGLALLFDEGDRMLSITARAEKTATDNLREVIDRCRDDLPGTMFVYAVPPEFIKRVVPSYPALQQRVQAPTFFSRTNPFSPQINLDRLDIPDSEVLTKIGERLLPIFEVAYGVTLDAAVQAQNIALFSKAARDSFLAISHRRLFVKTLIGEWFRQKEQGEQVVNADYAQRTIRGESDALLALPDLPDGAADDVS